MPSGNRIPCVFLPHGGGPCFFMDWDPPDTWDRMAAWLRGLVGRTLKQKPNALLVISAHWETDEFNVTAAPKPELIYDYSGFPPHTYQIKWPAPGSPALASEVCRLLQGAGIDCQENHQRGLDHGVFIPLKLAFPEADVPVVQLSLKRGLDPLMHVQVGEALAALREQGVLIVGSGMSYHNMQRFQRTGGQPDPASEAFDHWLQETIAALPSAERADRLLNWADAPGGRQSHPREEHLLPLHVVTGAAAGDAGIHALRDQVMGSIQSAFLFSASPE